MDTQVKRCTFRRGTEKDLPEIAALFRRHNYGIRRSEWLHWKYFQNPDGPARIYVAEDEEKGIIGLTARTPRRFTSTKTGAFDVFQNVDLFMAEQFRNKGIYGKLSKFAGNERNYFLIGFPNELSHVVNELDHVIPLEVWLFPLALSQLKVFFHHRAASFLLDLFSEMYTLMWFGSSPRNIQMKPVIRFKQDFDVPSDFIQGVRSAAFLNWRFCDNPTRRLSSFEFIENGESIGYCVYAFSGTAAEIYDLVCIRRQRECMRLLIDHCRSWRFSHLSFQGVNLRLHRFGFMRCRSREDCILSDIRNGPRAPEGPWMLTLADRDV
ncbi:MAG: hypothetical protein C4520_16485 [Candidatus Abyssobacteria bacterium SURF_5]|uniref:GNAT family N-acetyltransferase n=1 Tax=Abyssobacteria bacterium (strain SURF_5) TaxID=2093360 RepID=A0A3A4NQ08_ABYX5|nr:MAG: hypothetical protein C4520_16485 [Candidatus Abyssubacteria bacterium SURF_5]